ncbi:hypothetical protein [Sulfitobacter guttiformis]|uniref:Uncharacterized protein n=1 Tax=Sulfitobacter guttiformis TaxID=74349 RepID=A0A420DNS5_9RHOB|nr:hypothetical protein [Sulfitobacter guttiformis]KIN73197.1 hypothetical protein Z949_2383 [Sulfitobacter guttiformis KCTC 32187]RKE95875.1 hypothetical protein C8N30_0420 [Sulfitobacter guttiformis]
MSDLASTLFSVVMVGHSLFGTAGPDMLDAALRETSAQVEVREQIINGAPLKYNWEKSSEAQGIDARRVLPQGKTTDLIITEAIPLANHLQWSETEIYAQAFAGLALSGKSDARVFVQETWHSLKSGTGEVVEFDENADTPWRLRLQENLADWESIVALLRKGQAGADSRVQLIPAGQALGRLDDAIEADEVPGLQSISDVFDDDIHLNARGHYFVSMVQYAILTGASPIGLPHTVKDRFGQTFDGPDAEMADAMQRVALEAVKAYTRAEIADASPRVTPAAAPVAPRAPPSPPASEAKEPLTPKPAQPEPTQEQTQATPAPQPQSTSREAPAGAIAVGLAPVTDWAAQQPFLDVMKTARPWLGHLKNQFGGIENEALVAGGHIDADGWVRSMPREAVSVGTLILTDLPAAAAPSLQGRYVLRYDGAGVIEPAGRATNIRYARGEVQFDYTPGPGSVELRIQRTNLANPIRDITVVREDRLALFDSGALFNPDWTDRLAAFDTLRFMDWMETNNSTQALWEDRPLVTDASWAHKGVPLEVMLALINSLGKNAWFNMPHLADDTFVRNFAKLVQGGIDPARTAYVEYSNEVWNFQFAQTRWADEQAQARWGQADVGTQFYAMRAADVARIWSQAFAAGQAKLVNVISTQTGWLGLEANILNAPLVVAEGLPKPVEAFDAYAVTGYFGGILGLEARGEQMESWLDESVKRATQAAQAEGLTGAGLQERIEATQYDYATMLAAQELENGSVSGQNADTISDLAGRVFPYHAQVAAAAGLELIMYEGGTHIVGIGAQVDDPRLAAFFEHFNYTPQMGALYTALLEGWAASGGRLFNAYADVYVPTKWGSWGALRHLDDVNPRWDALVAGQ